MVEFHIHLREPEDEGGSYYEMPKHSTVEDWGTCLRVIRAHTCTCGDHHNETLATFLRDQVRSAWVTRDGLSMSIWSEQSPSDRKATP